jgi:hypothetical protein
MKALSQSNVFFRQLKKMAYQAHKLEEETKGRSRSRLTVRKKSEIKGDTELVEPLKVLPLIILRPVHLK